MTSHRDVDIFCSRRGALKCFEQSGSRCSGPNPRQVWTKRLLLQGQKGEKVSERKKNGQTHLLSHALGRTHTCVLSPICSIVHALYSTLPSHHTHTHTYTHASKNSIQECTSSYEQVKIILGFVLLKKRVPREDIGLRR